MFSVCYLKSNYSGHGDETKGGRRLLGDRICQGLMEGNFGNPEPPLRGGNCAP